MVFQLITLQKAKQPLINSEGMYNIYDDRSKYISQNLYKRIKHMPEMLSLLDSTVNDHFMGEVDFYDKDGKPLGPTKLKKIKNFWDDKCIQRKAFYGQAMDYFTDGSSFGWHKEAGQMLSPMQQKVINQYESSFGHGSMNDVVYMPREVSYLPASTITIKHNAYGEEYYIQDAAGKQAKWELDEVVHIKLMDFNGEIRGMSPLKALTYEIATMFMLKDNIIAKMQNGGSPDYIISLKNGTGMGVNKSRFERLRTALESFSHLRKSHGNMPIDAEVNVHALGTDLKDMEYRELAMFVISEYALALGIPTSRVPFLMTGSGGSSNKGELSGNSEDSYQTKINTRRKQWEQAWNKVFKKAGFTFKFRRSNLQDDVRETQALTQNAAYVTSVQNSLQKVGKKLKISTHLAMLSGKKIDIGEDDIEDLTDEEKMTAMPGFGGNNNMKAGPGGLSQPDKTQLASKVTQDRSMSKEKTASNNGRNS